MSGPKAVTVWKNRKTRLIEKASRKALDLSEEVDRE